MSSYRPKRSNRSCLLLAQTLVNPSFVLLCFDFEKESKRVLYKEFQRQLLRFVFFGCCLNKDNSPLRLKNKKGERQSHMTSSRIILVARRVGAEFISATRSHVCADE